MMDKSVSILGTRGIPARHGGFETFAQNLALYLAQKGWRVTVYCQDEWPSPVTRENYWQDVELIQISPYVSVLGKVLGGALGTALFDWRSVWHARRRESGVWLTLGYNTGVLNLLPKLWQKKQIINMDGVEWRRGKWSWPLKLWFYTNYHLAGRAADRVIADHPEIEKMLHGHFNPTKTTMIAYGAPEVAAADVDLLKKYALEPGKYMVSIARIEPENSILEIVRAWSCRTRGMKLVVLGNFYKTNTYHQQIREAASDEVIFPGAIFDAPVVQSLRFHALAYLHGHTVGGTNPSLVEALGAGNAVIAHDNAFNRWVAGEAGTYFSDEVQLSRILDIFADDVAAIARCRQAARKRHVEMFRWEDILAQYEKLMCDVLSEQRSLPIQSPAPEAPALLVPDFALQRVDELSPVNENSAVATPSKDAAQGS